MIFNIDVDNTVNNFLEEFIYFVNGFNPKKKLRLEDITEYNLVKSTGLPADVLDVMFFRNSKFYQQLTPLPNCVNVIKDLVKNGHQVRFVTAIEQEIVQTRAAFLKTWFPFIDLSKCFIVTGDKHHIWADVVIEDYANNLTNINPNCKFLLFDQPWNKNFDERRFERCYSWFDVYNHLIRICKND